MCERAVAENSWCLDDVPDQFKTLERCEKALGKNPQVLEYVPDRFITPKNCDDIVLKKHIF